MEAHPSSSSSGEEAESRKEVDLRTPGDYNQVEVKTTSGEVHYVEYVLRHPNREWMYAQKVAEVDNSGIHSNDLVFRTTEIESIEARKISTESPERELNGQPVDTHSEQSIWVHHTVPIEYVSTDIVWKAWPSDEEVSEFQTPEN